MWKKRNHFVCFPRALLHHATGRRYRPSVHGPKKAVLSCRPNSNGGTFHFGVHSCFIDNVFPCHRLCVRTIAKSKAVVGYTTANEKKKRKQIKLDSFAGGSSVFQSDKAPQHSSESTYWMLPFFPRTESLRMCEEMSRPEYTFCTFSPSKAPPKSYGA